MPILLDKFRAIISTIEYKEIPDLVNKGTTRFVADITMKERGKGETNSNSVYAALIYLSKSSWEDKIFGVGDIIEFPPKTKWKSKPFSYMIKDPNYIKKSDPSRVKTHKGIPYVPITIYNYQLRAPEIDVKLICKSENVLYCTISKSHVRLPLENMKDFIEKKKIKWMIGAEEYEKLFSFNGEKVSVLLYTMRTLRTQKNMEVKLAPYPEIDKYSLILTEV